MSRILLSAYACEPGKGSEPGVGWMWAIDVSSRGHDVWVITRTANREAIEREHDRRAHPSLNFIYCDLPRWAQACKRFPGGIYAYYFFWQWIAYRQALRLHRIAPFDCVHHVTFVSLRAPSFMGRIGIPFYLGPVSGGERVPWKLRRGMSVKARCFELLRDCANLTIRLNPLIRATFRSAERIYLASTDSLTLIPRRYRGKCRVQLAVGVSRTELGFTSRSIASPASVLRCLYVGRLLEWKGLRLALLAIQRANAQGTPVHLTLIGSGTAQRKLQALAQRLKITDCLEWIPWLPHDQVQRRFQQYHLFLFPSLRDSGGMATLEALAHGLPVVCVDRGGPAVIVNSQCGHVVSTLDRTNEQIADSLAEHLTDLARNRLLLERLSLGARRRAWEFDFGRNVDAIYRAAPNVSEQVLEAAYS